MPHCRWLTSSRSFSVRSVEARWSQVSSMGPSLLGCADHPWASKTGFMAPVVCSTCLTLWKSLTLRCFWVELLNSIPWVWNLPDIFRAELSVCPPRHSMSSEILASCLFLKHSPAGFSVTQQQLSAWKTPVFQPLTPASRMQMGWEPALFSVFCP